MLWLSKVQVALQKLNLKANDIVNMRIAKMTQAPVYLIADIDRGGAIASIVGTLELLEPEERDLIKGIVINKFRGDIKLLEPALTFIEEKTGKKVVGVIPAIENLDIDEEDSVALENKRNSGSKEIQVVVNSKHLKFLILQTSMLLITSQMYLFDL